MCKFNEILSGNNGVKEDNLDLLYTKIIMDEHVSFICAYVAQIHYRHELK